MIDFPREPNPGENLDASWGARVVRALRALFPMPGPGINVSTGPSGTTISSAPADEEKQTKPPELFECRQMIFGGATHTGCYVGSGANLVALGANLSAPGPAMNRISQNSPWVDLGTGHGGVYLYFVDSGSSNQPRWRWQLAIVDDNSSFPPGAIDHFPIVPIAVVGTYGAIVQLHTGSIAITEPWFWPVSYGQYIGLKLMGPNGNVLAKFNDTDSGAGGISAEFKGKVSVAGDTSVGGDLTLSGKLSVGNESYKPAWVTIPIDGVQYTVLAKGRTRP